MIPEHALETTEELREDLVEGLRYVHHQLGANTGKALETASFLYALIELLMKKGLLTEQELNAQKVEVAKRLVEKFRERGMGAVFQDPEHDKYTLRKKRSRSTARIGSLCAKPRVVGSTSRCRGRTSMKASSSGTWGGRI